MDTVILARGFNVSGPTKAPAPNGQEIDVMTITVVDVVSPGRVVIQFAVDQWAKIQEAVADPEGFEKRAQARSRIVPAGGLPPVRPGNGSTGR